MQADSRKRNMFQATIFPFCTLPTSCRAGIAQATQLQITSFPPLLKLNIMGTKISLTKSVISVNRNRQKIQTSIKIHFKSTWQSLVQLIIPFCQHTKLSPLSSQPRQFTLTLPLLTQVYKWVLTNLVLGVQPCDGLAYVIQGISCSVSPLCSLLWKQSGLCLCLL